jgi:hypothetical protein
MSRTKKQHYVPQVYLRQFSADGETVWAFDKSRLSSWRASTRDVAMENLFYQLPVPEGDDFAPQTIEDILQREEDRYADVLKRIAREGPRAGLSPEDKAAFAPFLGLQLVRSREYRQQLIQVAERLDVLREKWSRALAEAHGVDAAVQWFDEHGNEQNPVPFDRAKVTIPHAQMILREIRERELAGVVHRHVWVLGLNETVMPLYTSDQPIVRRPHVEQAGPHSYSGLTSPGIELALPLGPRLVLLMYERQYHHHLARHEGSVVRLRLDAVWHYNSLQVVQANRQVYCDSDEFVFARQVCEQFPEVRAPNRRMVFTSEDDTPPVS